MEEISGSIRSHEQLLKFFYTTVENAQKHYHLHKQLIDFRNNAKVLVDFVFRGYPDQLWQTHDIPDSYCGKTFRQGHLMFVCLNCSYSEDSVLCPQCFMNSEHKNHDYRIFCSQKSHHFCTCGQVEAWKKFHSCSLHDPKIFDYETLLTKEIYSRGQIVIETALNFIHSVFAKRIFRVEILTNWPIKSPKIYFLSLYNNCDLETPMPMEMLTKICHYGVKSASVMDQFCNGDQILLKDKINVSERAGVVSSNFDMAFVSLDQILEEKLAYTLMDGLFSLLLRHPYFRKCFHVAVTQKSVMGTVLELFMRKEELIYRRFTEKFKALVHIAMVRTAINEISGFRVKSFNETLCCKKHVVCTINTFTESLCLFSFPAVTQLLIKKENFLSLVGKEMVLVSKFCGDNFWNINTFDCKLFHSLSVIFRNLLKSKALAFMNYSSMRYNFLDGVLKLLEVAMVMEGMEETSVNAIKIHDWKRIHQLNQLYDLVMACFRDILAWCSSHEEIILTIFNETVERVNNKVLKLDGLSFGHVSIYLPLLRFFGQVCVLLGPKKYFDLPESIVKPVIRIQTMVAEIKLALMCASDHIPTMMQVYCDNTSNMQDQDIQLLQLVASTMDNNKFILMLQAGFQIEVHVLFKECFLKLLINIIGERYRPKISLVEENACLKKEILHQACLQVLSHSELSSKVRKKLGYSSVFYEPESAINELTISKGGVQELKEEFLQQYDTFHLHYSEAEAMASFNNVCKRQKRNFCPPPRLPKLHQLYGNINGLLICNAMHEVLKDVLETIPSEIALQAALHLIGYALQDEELRAIFVQSTKSWALVDHLKKLLTMPDADLQQGLIRWTLTKYCEMDDDNEFLGEFEENQKKKELKELAAKTRAKLVGEIAMNRNKFVEQNKIVDDDVKEEINEEEYTCILCQKTEKLLETKDLFLVPTLCQNSNVFCARNKKFQMTYPFFDFGNDYLTHTTTCSHVMHRTCWVKFRKSSWERNPRMERHEEILTCPMCGAYRKTLLPVVPSLFNLKCYSLNIDFQEFLNSIFVGSFVNTQISIENISLDTPESLLSKILQKTKCLEIPSIVLAAESSYGDILDCKPYSAARMSLAYTLHATEVSLRDSKTPLLSNVLSNREVCLMHLARICQFVTYEDFDIRLFINFDPVLILVQFVFFTNLIEFFPFVVRFALLIKIVKTIMYFGKFTKDSSNVIISNEDWIEIQRRCQPFLRCAMLLRRALTNEPPPSNLTVLGGDTFENLCSALNIPSSNFELLNGTHVSPFLSFMKLNINLYECRFFKMNFLTKRLTDLPENYNDLILWASTFTCPSSKEKKIPKFPMLCLDCGKMLCGKEMCCTELVTENISSWKGACHLHTSSAGVGIFLSINEGHVVLLYALQKKVIFYPLPYVNKYKETKLTHKLPLKLDHKKYEALNTMWINHRLIDQVMSKEEPEGAVWFPVIF